MKAVQVWDYSPELGELTMYYYVSAQNPIRIETDIPDGVYQEHDIHLWRPGATGKWEGSFGVWTRRKNSLESVGTSQTLTLVDSVTSHRSKAIQLNISFPAPPLQPDSLYAVPCNIAAPGEPVLIQVVSGEMQQPFQYLTGVRVTAPAESGFTYVPNSFNVGAPGGARNEADGLWAAMQPEDFLLLSESMIRPTTTSYGYLAYDFNITPLGGRDLIAASGALFNFQATFSQLGANDIRFQVMQAVDRTYFQDGTLTAAHRWYDTTNDQFGHDGEAIIWKPEAFTVREGQDPNTYWYQSGISR